MSKLVVVTAAVALSGLASGAAARAETAPPGCRWQNSSGGQILACKDAQGYWRRSGDDEIVGYDPPRARATVKAQAAPPALQPPPLQPAAETPPAPDAAAVEEMPNVVSPLDEADRSLASDGVAHAAPAEPPIEPKPPGSPLEAFFMWLLQMWRAFQAWMGSLF